MVTFLICLLCGQIDHPRTPPGVTAFSIQKIVAVDKIKVDHRGVWAAVRMTKAMYGGKAPPKVIAEIELSDQLHKAWKCVDSEAYYDTTKGSKIDDTRMSFIDYSKEDNPDPKKTYWYLIETTNNDYTLWFRLKGDGQRGLKLDQVRNGLKITLFTRDYGKKLEK